MNNDKILEEQGKPLTGTPRYVPGAAGFGLKDDQGNAVGESWYSIQSPTPSVDDQNARIGDYVLQKGKAVVVPNSPTDLSQKYKIAIGGTEAPRDTVSIANEGIGVAAGAAIGSIFGPAGILAGGLIGGLNAHNTAAEKALEDWKKENVKYDTAVEFYRDDKGDLKYKLDYNKMGTGGVRSGEGVKEAQERDTKVALGDDGRLKITVSPIFASTERFRELAEFISENYAGLSKDTENLDEVLTEIKNGIDGEAKDYIMNMRLYADFANRFPDATPESIVRSYNTEISGYVDPQKMSDRQVAILDDNNNTQIKSASEFFDSVLAMNKDGRNNLAKKLNEVVYGDGEYSDDQKSIAYGELQAIFIASANPEKYENDKYQGMMDADAFASFLNSFAPLGLRASDVVRFISGGNIMNTSQEYLNQDEWAQFIGGSLGLGAGFGLWKGGTALIEKGLKSLPGTSKLFQASLSGMGQSAAKAAIAKGGSSAAVKIGAAEAAFKTLKVGLFDAALSGTKTAVSGTDFWSEFGKDIARDATLEAVFSYYDMVSFQKQVDSGMTWVYLDKETGKLKKLDTYQGEKVKTYEYADDGLITDSQYEYAGKVYSDKGVSVIQSASGATVEIVNGKIKYTPASGKTIEGEILPDEGLPFVSTGVSLGTAPTTTEEMVRISLEKAGLPKDTKVFALPSQTADAAVIAGKVASMQGTKAGMGIYSNLFNKYAVLDTVNNLALAKTGDLNSWRDAQESFVSIMNNAQAELNAIQNGAYIEKAAAEWDKTLEIIGSFNYQYKYKPKIDGAYINAINQIERAQLLNDSRVEGDKTDYVAKALEKYGNAISKMPADRAQALQNWLAQGKKWLLVFNKSAIKSGKIDPKKLENMMESDVQSQIGYFPVWGKKETNNDLLSKYYGISQKRDPFKEWLRDGEWVDLDKLEDPYTAMTRYMGFVANNMGFNDMIEKAAMVLEKADLLVDNTPTDATIRKKKLESIKNKDELKKKLEKMVEEKKKEVESKTLTPKQYNEMMVKLYTDSAIAETALLLSSISKPEDWDNFWKNAPAQVRKDIRSELEKTSLQTGYGIKDTRARLNAQVPGFDVLDWSLLGREHTNGLVEGGLYPRLDNRDVNAYIIDLDDLVKMVGYDLSMAMPDMGKIIERDINTKGGKAILPVHIRNGKDGTEIWLKDRWGNSSDGVANWVDYLASLKEQGVQKVPIAIEDARGSDFNSVFYRVRNTGIAQRGLDNIVNEIDKAIATGKAPDLSARDVSAALHLPGYNVDRLRRRIRNSIPANGGKGVSHISDMELKNLFDEAGEYDWKTDKELRASADTIENIIKEKIGYIPQDITEEVKKAFSEYGQIPFYRGQTGLGEFNMNNLSSTRQVGDAYWIAPNASYTDSYGKDKIAGTIPVKYFMSDKEKQGVLGNIYKELKAIQDKAIAVREKKVQGDASLAEKSYATQISEGLDLLGKRDNDKFRKLKQIVDAYVDAGEAASAASEGRLDPQNVIVSYRALAEYAKKPVIDISEDDFANGTAFFYYKDVDPKFDEEIGKQLLAQAAVEGTGWTSDDISTQAEKLDSEMTVQDLINAFIDKEESRMPEIASNFLTDMYDAIDANDSADAQQYWNYFLNAIVSDDQEIESVRQTLDRSWDGDISGGNNTENVHLKLTAMVDTMGEGSNIARNLFDFLEIPAPESKMAAPTAEDISIVSKTKPTAENIPNNPVFKQPGKVTYEDYLAGTQADSAMAGRIRDSYKAALAERLIKEASRVAGLAEDYLSPYAWGFDVESYLNTSLIPDLQNAINKKSVSTELSSFIQARMAQAVQDIAPYQSPEMVLKSQLENVAQDWHDWAVKHIKSGRASQKDLTEFAGSHNLELPDDKRPIAQKVKHSLWEMVKNGKRLPDIENLEESFKEELLESAKNPNVEKTEDDILAGKFTETVFGMSLSRMFEDIDTSDLEKLSSKEIFYSALDKTPLFQSSVKDKNELVDLVASEINGETTDGYEMGAAAKALGMGGRYPITWINKGRPYTRLIKYRTEEERRWAEEITSLFTDKELVKQEGMISRFASGLANDFRLLTTGWNPTRILPNLTRDTTRSVTVGTRFIQAKKTLQGAIELGEYTTEQKEKMMKAIENAAESAENVTYNSAYRSPKGRQVSITKQYMSKNGIHPFKRFWYNIKHDKRSIAEFPMDFFEGFSRRQNAYSLAAVQLGKDQKAGKSYDEQMKNAIAAANFAGREYTANFQRKGKLIGRTSKYVAYQSSSYAGLDGMMRAFIDNPKLFSRNFAVFVIAYLLLLGDTLSREETRKQYYRLSEYDRENQIVIGMGNSILTIPMDQELAGLLFPYRRIMETLNGTDPVSFFEFVWGTLTSALPMDLSGFSEDGSFNLARGLEKLTAQNMPTALTPIQEAATGYDLYYGSKISVSDEDLKERGIYSPQPGDYTTTSKDSAFLRSVANFTGIPQWQLQAMMEGYGGNVGKYVLNIIDKAAGATKEQQGGKEFADSIFSSFTALDQDAAANRFYSGIKQLQGEKNKLLQQIANYNEQLKTASGDAKIGIQLKIQKAKEDYGVKVGDFVDQYVSAYEITGGLPKSQAMQIYYLFRLDDDNTIYESGSVEDYYNNQSKQKFKNQATALSAPILDKYYNNRIGNIYQDSDGVWRRYLSGGAQAMRNSIYGQGEEHMVNLLNILENKTTGLTELRKQVKSARSKAYDAKDFTTRNKLGYEFDKKVISAISPYIEKYGAENVLGNSEVLDYLSDWFFVPDDFKKTKRGGYVSLANNAQTDEAFVRPYIKYVFGLPTNYYSYSDAKLVAPEIGK